MKRIISQLALVTLMATAIAPIQAKNSWIRDNVSRCISELTHNKIGTPLLAAALAWGGIAAWHESNLNSDYNLTIKIDRLQTSISIYQQLKEEIMVGKPKEKIQELFKQLSLDDRKILQKPFDTFMNSDDRNASSRLVFNNAITPLLGKKQCELKLTPNPKRKEWVKPASPTWVKAGKKAGMTGLVFVPAFVLLSLLESYRKS